MDTIIVGKVNIRLDAYVAEERKQLSRTMIQKLIESGNILVNGSKKKLSYKVQMNDQITINLPEAKETNLKPQEIPIEIIYEDNDIIVVNKPKGLVVHPANGNPDGTLVNAIMAICKESLSGIGGELRPGIVHRLDKDTSGLLIVAKNDRAHINMSEQIKNHEVRKIYIALVRGVVQEDEATIDMPIGRSTKDRKKMAVVKDGKNAVTHFKVLKRYPKYTLLEIKIDTGRTHQIRVHMMYINHPLLGDTLYGNSSELINRQALHSYKTSFIHPILNIPVTYIAPLPEDIKNLI